MNEVRAGQARIFLRGDGIIVVVAENTQSHTVSDAEEIGIIFDDGVIAVHLFHEGKSLVVIRYFPGVGLLME